MDRWEDPLLALTPAHAPAPATSGSPLAVPRPSRCARRRGGAAVPRWGRSQTCPNAMNRQTFLDRLVAKMDRWDDPLLFFPAPSLFFPAPSLFFPAPSLFFPPLLFFPAPSLFFPAPSPFFPPSRFLPLSPLFAPSFLFPPSPFLLLIILAPPLPLFLSHRCASYQSHSTARDRCYPDHFCFPPAIHTMYHHSTDGSYIPLLACKQIHDAIPATGEMRASITRIPGVAAQEGCESADEQRSAQTEGIKKPLPDRIHRQEAELWWRWGESNPRPEKLDPGVYKLSPSFAVARSRTADRATFEPSC